MDGPTTEGAGSQLEEETFDHHQDIARSAFADMLHDTERNQKYFKGIEAAVNFMHRHGRKAHVLDIGTGTGLLSMMAVKCGADSVTACESFAPVAKCAQAIINANGLSHQIKLIAKNSMRLKVGANLDMAQRANILVTEVFDTELIGEGALSIFEHAHKHLLERGCIVVPHSATVYAQVVESPLALSWHKLKWVIDGDSGCPLVKVPELVETCAGSACLHDLQLGQFPVGQFQTVLSPTAVIRFDWSGKTQVIKKRHNLVVQKAERNGTAQVVFVWWELAMDATEKVVLSCAPFWAHPDMKADKVAKEGVPWRDHWMQSVYFLPVEVRVRAGEEVTLISSHDEYSMWFNLKRGFKLVDDDYERSVCVCGLHSVLSRGRFGQLNDPNRIQKYISVLQDKITSASVCLCLSDVSLLGFIAAKLGARKVYCVSGVHIAREALAAFAARNTIADRIEFLDNVRDCARRSDAIAQVTLVIGEPFFNASLLPWDNLFYLRCIKEDLGMLAADVDFMPERCMMKAVAVSFDHLHKIKQTVKECEAFDMQLYSRFIQSSSEKADASVEPQPLWEYPGKALSLPMDVMEFHILTYSTKTSIEFIHEIQFETCGLLNGVAFWTDWYLDYSPKNKITSGPILPVEIGKDIRWDMYSKQGVYLLRHSISIKPGDILKLKISFINETFKFGFQLNDADI